MILKTGTYWADGSTYQTEVQSNTKFELKGTGAGIYFIVTAPDGSRSWYGNFSGTNASDLTAYYITRFEDTNGNYITYNYTNPFGKSLCVSEIKFSGNTTGIAPINNILFTYKQASRSENAYIKGVKLEKVAILDFVEVKTNNQLFRKYKLTHASDNLGYQRVTQIQEYNGALEPANPIVFEYETTLDSVNTVYQPPVSGYPLGIYRVPVKWYNNTLNFNQIDLSGDFDGDGRLDFIAENAFYNNLFNLSNITNNNPSFLPFTAVSGKTFAVNTISNNKLCQSNVVIDIAASVGGGINLNYYKINSTGNNMVQYFTKNISTSIPNVTYQTTTTEINEVYENAIAGCMSQNNCGDASPEGDSVFADFTEGDFNGDGVSEIIVDNIVSNIKVTQNIQMINYLPEINGTGNYGFPVYLCQTCSQQVETITNKETLIIDTNENVTGYNVLNDPLNLLPAGKKYLGDYNGDGKTDILFFTYGGYYKILTIENNTVILIGQGILPEYSEAKPCLFGDYNGDGKIDIMIPVFKDTPYWRINYANPKPNGGAFFETVTIFSVLYHPTQSGDTYRDWTDYYAMDINKDGKTDIVSAYRNYFKPGWTINDHDTSWRIQAYVNNLSTNGTFNLYYDSGLGQSDDPEIPIVVPSNYKNVNLNSDLILVRGGSNLIELYGFKKNVQTDNLLKKVISSGGNIIDEISYHTMEPFIPNLGNDEEVPNFYSSNNSLNYPNVEITKLPTMQLVSQIRNTVGGITRYQDFKYNGFVVNLHGLGNLGFKSLARSSWYNNNSQKLWSITVNNPLLRNATICSYSLITSSQFLLPGSAITGGFPNGISSYTSNFFSSNTTNNIFKIQLDKQITVDGLTRVSNETNYSYDPNFLLPLTTISKNILSGVLQSTTTTTNTYDNSPAGTGSNYYIGRPKNSTTIVSAYSDTSESSIEYIYNNNRLTKTKKKGNTASAKYLVEDFEYFANGNIKKKTISTEGYTGIQLSPRSTEYTYDTSGRFVKTIKDLEGLITTNNTFHPLYGTVLSSTSPFGQKSTSILDNWGKPTKVTDYLGKSINLTYVKTGNTYTERKNGDDGSMSIAVSDALGRVIKVGSKNIDDSWSYKDTQYDSLGRKFKESEPYAGSSPTLWNTTTFDSYNRPASITASTGKTTNITYSSSSPTVTTNDGFKTLVTTKNANGQVVSSSDNGGIINYTYFANGNLKTSNYEGTIISYEYDEWGNKTKLTDPSAGMYTYTYYPSGETRTQTTPKGTTTFDLDTTTGKLLTKTIQGENTHSVTTNSYDGTTKLLNQATFVDVLENASSMPGATTTYNYFYDTNQRIIKIEEKNDVTNFVRDYTYDAFGRTNTETYFASKGDLESTKTIQNTYKNGAHWQILNADSQTVLWESTTVNERGQLTSGFYGNGVAVKNEYDQHGFVNHINHSLQEGIINSEDPPIIHNKLDTFYTFEPLRGNLTFRSNSIFPRREFFNYDSQDRLIGFTNTLGVQEAQTYDNKGRITGNTVGTYSYANTAKKYQNTSVTLATNTVNNYDVGSQDITYNVFKSPVRIFTNNDFINFTYNINNNRAVMYYGNREKEKINRTLSKYYDASGTMEIKYNKDTQEAEFITYLGGNGYSAPVAYKSLGRGGDTEAELLYLHRDYQGSILAITNQNADILEQRLFDAWGNLVSQQDENGNEIYAINILDRGYTGHEHLQSVGLIHMNGRLYDPKLHRFLQPDNYVQDPYNTQNYNRYGYVLNNPLKYTDPSGEIISFVAAVAIGAAVSAVTYLLTALTSDTPFSFGGLAQATFIGAASATVTFGIGTAVGTIGGFWLKTTVQALAHGTFQGAMTGVQGGNFWNGFAAGALSSIASSLYAGGTNTELNAAGDRVGITGTGFNSIGDNLGGAGMIAFGTIAGGAGAALTGGNFWQGAVTGLVVSGLNHYAHSGDDGDSYDQEDPKKEGPHELKPLKYNSLNFEKNNNVKFKSYATRQISNLKKDILVKKNDIRKIENTKAEIERSMADASDGTGGDKGMAFGAIINNYVYGVKIEKIEIQIKNYQIRINQLQTDVNGMKY